MTTVFCEAKECRHNVYGKCTRESTTLSFDYEGHLVCVRLGGITDATTYR